jgi:hypothetical protein
MHADRTNRMMLVLFALLLTGAGLSGALISFGAFGAAVQHARLLANPVSVYVGHHGVWLWLVIGAAAAVLAVLALRWLTVLMFSTDRAGDIRITGDRSGGLTTLLATALTDTVTEEAETYPGVHSVKTRLIGDPISPDLVIEANLEESADLSALRQRIETHAVAHARQALDDPNLRVTLNLTVSDHRTRRISRVDIT